jgi:hypothetical protein
VEEDVGDLDTAIRRVLKFATHKDGVIKGLREVAKSIEQR